MTNYKIRLKILTNCISTNGRHKIWSIKTNFFLIKCIKVFKQISNLLSKAELWKLSLCILNVHSTTIFTNVYIFYPINCLTIQQFYLINLIYHRLSSDYLKYYPLTEIVCTFYRFRELKKCIHTESVPWLREICRPANSKLIYCSRYRFILNL